MIAISDSGWNRSFDLLLEFHEHSQKIMISYQELANKQQRTVNITV